MKLKTTKKQIVQNSTKIIRCGYCAIQALLHYESPFAYSAGTYGWACDYYNIDGVIISTGYQPIGTPPPSGLQGEYEKVAEGIVYGNYEESYESKKERTTALLKEFIQKAID